MLPEQWGCDSKELENGWPMRWSIRFLGLTYCQPNLSISVSLSSQCMMCSQLHQTSTAGAKLGLLPGSPCFLVLESGLWSTFSAAIQKPRERAAIFGSHDQLLNTVNESVCSAIACSKHQKQQNRPSFLLRLDREKDHTERYRQVS